MKYLRNKILIAINKGLNEVLNLDDFSEDDLKINKKSLGSIIKNSNLDNNKPYYQDLMNMIMSKNIKDITKNDILNCIDWYKEYGVLYNPINIVINKGNDSFCTFIRKIINIYGNNVNLNFIDTSEITYMYCMFFRPSLMEI